MNLSLTRVQRALLLFLSASGYLAWFSGVGERLEAQGIVGSPTPSLTIAPRPRPPRISTVIKRDPFAGAPNAPRAVKSDVTNDTERPEGRADFGTRIATAANLTGPVPDPGGPSVPNVGDARSGGVALTLVVRATIVGANPVAYVANGTMMDIVRVGDRLGDRRIARIDLRGLAFNDGTRLDLPGNFEPTPGPQKQNDAVTIRLGDLRKLLSGQGPPRGRQSPAPAPLAAAPGTPAPVGTFPTPGPLPTVNQRGIPVGTNPTSDPNAPTPYPQPYPYAPPARPR